MTTRTAPAKKAPAKKALAKKAVARRAAPTNAHPLAHHIPASWRGDEYIDRDFEGFSDVAILEGCIDMKQNALLYGETGPGKTSAVFALGARLKMPVISVACNGGVDPSTMFARPVYQPDGSIDTVLSEVVVCMEEGGILLFDEINFLPPRIASVLHPALDGRRMITIAELGNRAIKLHDRCLIVATMNPDYAGTKPLNAAFRNRFMIQLEYTYSREIEEQLVVGIPCLLDLADNLRTAKMNGVIDTPTGPNRLMEFELAVEQYSVDFALYNFVSGFAARERAAVRNFMQHFDTQIRIEAAAMMGETYTPDIDAIAPPLNTDPTDGTNP